MNLPIGHSFKRALSFMVALALLCGTALIAASPASANRPASTVKAEVVAEDGEAGGTVTASVYLTPGDTPDYDSDIWKYALSLNYDPTVLTPVGEVADEAESDSFAATPSNGRIDVEANTFGSLVFISERQPVFSATFRISGEPASGTTNLTLSDGTFVAITDTVAIDQLVAGSVSYTNRPPEASDVAADGRAVVGAVLNGSYTYADAERNAESATTFRWYAADDAAGANKTEIAGAAASSYTLTEAELGKYIIFAVAPVAAAGTAEGAPVESAAIGPVQAAAEPEATAAAVAIGSVGGYPGQTVDVPVRLTSASAGIGAYGIRIAFDAASLEVASVTGGAGGLFDSVYNNDSGWLQAGWADESGGDHPAQAGQALFKISFRVKSDAALGDKALTVDTDNPLFYTVTDVEGAEADKTLTSGKVTVRAKPAPPANTDTTAPDAAPVGLEVLVNGKPEPAGTATTATVDGRKVTTVVVDPKKLEERLKAEGPHATITIPVAGASDAVGGELSGGTMRSLAQYEAVIQLKTDKATYSLPARELDMDALRKQLGGAPSDSDVTVRIAIAAATETQQAQAEAASAKMNFSLLAAPTAFTVTAAYGDRQVEIAKFSSYVERTIAVPEGVDPARITTALVIEPDGTTRHVPTQVRRDGDRDDAVIHSLTNSVYALVWHPLEFADVSQHWSRDAVNDLGSRMIVDGVSANRFEPNGSVTRAEFAKLLVRGLGLKEEAGTSGFADVASTAWYAGAVHTAAAYGLVSGFGDGAFRPDATVTREQAAAMIANAMRLTGLQAQPPAADPAQAPALFRDADDVAPWARNGIAECLQSGILTGRGASELAPKASVTRAEAAAMTQRLLQRSALIDNR